MTPGPPESTEDTQQVREGRIGQFDVLPDASAPGYARRWLRDALGRADGSDDPVDVLVLVVDELVTNAVVHANTPIHVTVERVERCYRCEVRDECRDGPLPRIIDLTEGQGRGLRLVDRFSVDWGVDRNPNGTAVWALIADEVG
jgi:anti-sigma regulatory factor (Ser/Thr protein kinase)